MSLGKKLFIGGPTGGACPTDSVQPFGAESAYSSNVALYQLDGNANDTVGNHNSTATNVTYSTGKFGQCAVFDGSSQYITTGVDSSDISMTNTSFSCWVNFTATSGTIMDNGGAASSGRGLILETGSGYIVWQQANGTGGQSTAITSASNSYNDGNWHHIVGTIDGNMVMKLYIDGNVESSTPTANSSASSPLYTLEIGRRASFNTQYFNGKIDQIRIYDKAISSDEVSILYNETASTASDTNVLGEGSGLALYSLDYDASDAGGNYDSTPTDVTFGVDGQINYGAKFNGSSSKITLPTGSPFNDSNTIKSISGWVKADTTTSRVYLYSQSSSTNASDYFYVGYLGDLNRIYVSVRDGSASNQNSRYADITPDTDWNHIVAQLNGSTVEIWLNGVQQTVTNNTSGSATSSSWIDYPSYDNNIVASIGTFRAVLPDYSDGSIDQVRFFKKALSQNEINTLVAETACVYTSTTDIVDYQGTNLAYYKLDNNAEDETGNYDGIETNITYEFGRFGQAAVFNGSNSYISLPGALANGTSTVANCISFWFYIDAEVTSSSPNNEIMTFAGSASVDGKIGLGSTTGHITNETFSVTSNVNSGEYTYSRTNIPAGWNHAVVQWNSGDTKWDIFINGVQHTTYTNGTNVQRHWKLKFGNRSTKYFTGKLDQIRIFDSALDATAVENLYNEKSGANTSNFEAVLYKGTGASGNYVSNVGFVPGLVWLKNRDASSSHKLFDSVRGDTQVIESNSTVASGVTSQMSGFEANGFILGGSASAYNGNNTNYVAWVWKDGGDAVSNTNGGITSQVSANQDAGFSIVKYTATGTTATVGHGLSSKPQLIIAKTTNQAYNWLVYAEPITAENHLILNLTSAQIDNTAFMNDTEPTSSVFTAGAGNNLNYANGDEIIAYCFHSVAGYQKVGSYEGNGTTRNVDLGFNPSWIMIKNADAGSTAWNIVDTRRDTDTTLNLFLQANTNIAESNTTICSLITDGFSVTGSATFNNSSGHTFIYLAIA